MSLKYQWLREGVEATDTHVLSEVDPGRDMYISISLSLKYTLYKCTNAPQNHGISLCTQGWVFFLI